jgi:hypothetical protein
MTNASKSSKAGVEPHETSDRRRAVAQGRLERREFYRLLAPPDVRHRRREARRWLDVLTVMSTNPCLSERRPGDGWLTNDEKKSIWDRADELLRTQDPELFRAVDRVRWEKALRDASGTVKEWQARVARRSPALKTLRAAIREEEACSHPMTWAQIAAVLQRRFSRPAVR